MLAPFLRWGVTAAVLTVLALGIYGMTLMPVAPDTSELTALKKHRSSIILSEQGKEITRLGRRGRRWVSLDEISPHVLNALIATEDRRFYTHNGIDLKRMAGALFYTLLGNRQGGSTITQQLARNLYPNRIGNQDLITRKLTEIITSQRIEQVYTKDEILETYLNTVPFLYNTFGIEMAAQTYFGKSAKDLLLPESAILVGMLKGTSYYNPVRHPKRARSRRNVVLHQLVKTQKLTPQKYQKLREQPLQIDFHAEAVNKNVAPHFTEYVREQVEKWAQANDYNLYTDGLVIHTTLNLELQKMARQAVSQWGDALQKVADVEWGRRSRRVLSTRANSYARYHDKVKPFNVFWNKHPKLLNTFIRETKRYREGVQQNGSPGALLKELQANQAFMDSLKTVKSRLEVGFTAVDPHTGSIRAWVGSRNYFLDQYDHVGSAQRQSGSTFKPFVYATALEQGYSPHDTLPDSTVRIATDNGDIWQPANAGEMSGKPTTLRYALAHSKNIVTARLTQQVGPQKIAQTARAMGVNQSKLHAVPSIGLGTSEVTLLEMASAYATIANRGVYRQPVAVSAIKTLKGKTLATFETSSKQSVSDLTAVTLLDMMRDVVDEGTGQGIRHTFGLEADLAGKTGTTQRGADGWFILMHPDLVAGSWVGFDDRRVTFRSSYWGQGAKTGLYVVGDFFQQALQDRAISPTASFPDPPIQMQEQGRLSQVANRLGRWVNKVANRVNNIVTGRDQPDLERYDSQQPSPPPSDPAPKGSPDEQERPQKASSSSNKDLRVSPPPAVQQRERRSRGW